MIVGFDWGSSTLRVFDLEPDSPREVEHTNAGLKRFASHDDLSDHVVATVERHTPVGGTAVMCGMITSKHGWRETPYISTPASIDDLASAATVTSIAERRVVLIPGVSHATDQGMEVMRGEETQLVGLDIHRSSEAATVVLPGTHCKWVNLGDGAIEDFRTFVTGELFELLVTHSLIGSVIEGDCPDPGSFELGVQRGSSSTSHGAGILNSLFSVRTRGLFEPSARHGLRSYLSGLLIGAEIAGANRPSQTTVIVGDGELARAYQRAFAALSQPVELAPEETTAWGLRAIAHAVGAI